MLRRESRADYQQALEELRRLDERLDRLREEVKTGRSLGGDHLLTEETRQHVLQLQQSLASELRSCIQANDTARLQEVLGQGADPNQIVDEEGNTVLHWAVATPGHEACLTTLLENKADFNLPNAKGETPYALACRLKLQHIVDVFDLHDPTSPKLHNVPANARGAQQSLSYSPTTGRAPMVASPTPGPSHDLHGTPSTPVPQSSASAPTADHIGLILVMVGLPARGKSYVSRKIQQYFAWNGLAVQIFSFRTYRREVCKIKGTSARLPVTDQDEIISSQLCRDVASFLRRTQGIAIIDGTFSTLQRRTTISDFLVSMCQCDRRDVIFLELELNNPDVVVQNIELSRQCAIEDGQTVADSETYTKNYLELIQAHQTVYTKMSKDQSASFIRVVDYETLELHQIEGATPTRLVYLLQNLSRQPSAIYLTTAGECEDDVLGRLGGGSALTTKGQAFAHALARYMSKELDANSELVVLRSPLLRAGQTCAYLAAFHRNIHLLEYPTLTDLSYGDADGQTRADVEATLPKTYQMLLEDPYNTAWPHGESIRQLFGSRIEPLLHEIQAKDVPTLIVSHKPLIQGFLSFFNETVLCDPSKAHTLDVPLHAVFKVTPTGSGGRTKVERIDLKLLEEDYHPEVLPDSHRDMDEPAIEVE